MPTNLTYDRGLILSWHAPAEIDVIAQLVNGNGIDPAENDTFDDDRFKNFGLRVVARVRPGTGRRLRLLGRAGGRGERPPVEAHLPRAGPGRRPRREVAAQPRVPRSGATTIPFFVGHTGPEYETNGGFAELHFFPQGQDGRWVLSALYNQVDSDDPDAVAENASLTVNYLIARNLRLLGEVAHDLDNDADRLTLGIVTAF